MNIRTTTIAALCAVAAISTTAFADGEEDNTNLSLTLSGTYNDGNTEDKSGNIDLEYKNVIENVGEYKLDAEGAITKTTVSRTETDAATGETKTEKKEETTAKNGKVAGKVIFEVADPFSVYVDASLFADEIADVDYRAITGAGIVWDIFKSDSTTVRFELGVAPMWEKIAGDTEYYTMGRVAESIEYKFGGGARVWESCEYLPAFNDSDKYLVNAEVGVESPLSGVLSLVFTVKERYNSLPGDGHEKDDLCAAVGVRVKM